MCVSVFYAEYIGIGFPIPVLDGVSLTDMSLIFRNVMQRLS